MSAARAAAVALPWLATAGLGVALGCQQIRSYDVWWHLRSGAWIVEHGRVPHADPFSYTAPGAPWLDVHWLFQLGLHGLHALGGADAWIVAKIVAVLACIALLACADWRRDLSCLAAPGIAVALVVASDRIMPRPELASFVLLAGVLALLARHERRGDRAIFLLPALLVVWANLHGLYPLGLFAAALSLTAEWLRPQLAGGPRRPVAMRRLALASGLALLACGLTPHGIAGLLYPLQQLGMIAAPGGRHALGHLSAELAPPFGGPRPLPVAHAGALLGLAVASAAALLANRRRLRGRDELLWLAFALLALAAKRNVALFAIVAAFLWLRHGHALLIAWRPAPRAHAALHALVAGCIALAAWDTARGHLLPRLGQLREPGFGVMQIAHPVAATDWIARERPAGTLAHHMSAGGYLIWRLYPEYRVMSDGRLEVYGAAHLRAHRIADPARLRALDAQYALGAVIVPFAQGPAYVDLLWALYVDADWRLVAVDEGGALFAKAQAGSGWPELDIDDPDLFPPLHPRAGATRAVQVMARVTFLSALRRNERALTFYRDHSDSIPSALRDPRAAAWLLERARGGGPVRPGDRAPR